MRDLIPDFNTYLFYKKEKKNIKTRSLFSGVGFGYRENIRMDNKKVRERQDLLGGSISLSRPLSCYSTIFYSYLREDSRNYSSFFV